VVGRDLRELVSRAIFMCQNAEYQLRARLLGNAPTLTSGETRLAGVLNAMPNVTNRTWEYWTVRLGRAGGLPPPVARTKPKSKARAGARPRAASAAGAGSRKTVSPGATNRKTGRTR
jgi:HCOMODA/2-hydroxy-3-carboxy-muconic semialdehyde decarboxylase